MNARRVVLGAWLGYVGLVTIRQLVDPQQRGLPPPRLYLASGVLFSMWYLAAGPAPTLAATLAVGTDIAALLLPYVAGNGTGPLDKLATFVSATSPGPGGQMSNGFALPPPGTSGSMRAGAQATP